MKKQDYLVGGILGILLFGKILLQDNFIYAFKWWFTLLCLGTVFLPITSLIFKKFSDNGWMFSKVIGIVISGVVTWFLSYAQILKYERIDCLLVVFWFLIINIFLYKEKKEELGIDKDKITKILKTETVFLCVFLFWSYVKCFTPTIDYTTEKYMNYGFLNVLFNTEYMPATDMWFSGFTINYYYFGQYLMSFLAKISFSNVPEAFNLSVAMINSFTFILPFSIGCTLGSCLVKRRAKFLERRLPIIIGVMSGLALSIGGTMYYTIYNLIMPRGEDNPYYYWEDTRYIGYRPKTDDQTINEILPYSNLVGDLHAHYIDTMLVFFTLALLLQLLLDDTERKTLKENLKNLNVIMLGIVLGVNKMTNFWDFPIYLVVMSITFIFNNIARFKFTKQTLITTIAQIAEIVGISLIVSVPFTLDFYMSASEVKLTHVTSPFYKMMVLWGFQTICVLAHVTSLIIKFVKEKNKGKEKPKFLTKVENYLANMNKSDLFAFIIGCCAIGLMIIPEIIYVKDIYADNLKRANTVYKVCYQAEILFDISVCYILVNFIKNLNSSKKRKVAIIFLIAYISTFGYGINGINYVTGKYNRSNMKSLTYTEGYIKENYPLEYDAIQWIKENVDRKDVILEKTGGSYNYISYVSVFTGNPTVLGWHGHEWIWRADKDYSSPDEEDRRWSDVNFVYGALDKKEIEKIFEKYNISYVYVSDCGTQDPVNNLYMLKSMGEVVYEKTNEANDIVCIIKVKKQEVQENVEFAT